MYTPPNITFNASFTPGGSGVPLGWASYFDLTILSSTSVAFTPTSASGQLIDAWCLDRDIDLFNGPLPPGVFYRGNLYSSAPAEHGILSAAMPGLAANGTLLNQLDSVNWLLNSYYNGALGANGIWQNVQGAMWGLLGENPNVNLNSDIAGGDQAAITALMAQALLPVASGGGDGYVADQGQQQYLGVIVDPRLVSPDFPSVNNSVGQPLIIPTLAARLGDFVWNDLNANGLQDANEPGVNGVTVTLFRDLDNSGSYNAGDLLLGTTVTGAGPDDPSTPGSETAGYYQFNGLTPGLQYQVQFTAPNGFGFTTPNVNANANDTTDSDATVGTGAAPAVVLLPGEFNRSIDAGLVPLPTASLGNYVWEDKNANGLQDVNDVGINGVTVQLLKDTDNNGVPDTVVDFKVTGDDPSTGAGELGFYRFTGLMPGVAYQVRFVNPDTVGLDAYMFSPANVGANDNIDSDADVVTGLSQIVTLSSGQYNDTVDAGLFRKGSIHPFAYLDNNGDGTQNGGDGPFPINPGKTFVLKDANGVIVFQGQTDVNGRVDVVGLTPGTYKLSELVPVGYSYSGAQTIERTFTITSGQELVFANGAANLGVGDGRTEVNLGVQLTWGNTQLASLGDRLWVDTNGNGLQDDGATGINGRTVTLIGGGADGLINGVGDTSVNTVTAGDGNYAFTGLTPGVQYQVQFGDKPAGTVFTTKDAGGNANDATDSDADLVTGRTQVVTLASGENNTTLDAGVYTPAAIGDKVFEDKNGDGQQGLNEPGIPNATVTLFTCVGGVPGVQVGAPVLTDINGNYSFTGLMPGDYIVRFTTPAGGFIQTTANVGADATDSDAGVGGLTGCYTLTSGQTNNTVDAGFLKPAALGDKVFLDANANGQQDAGENGVANVRVELYACVNNQPSGPLLGSRVTDANGIYGFDNLKPGDYIVKFITPAGYSLSPVNVGADGSDSDAGVGGFTACYNLESGETDNTVDAGIYLPAAIGDKVFEDKNGDGQQGLNEPGIPNATVTLFTCVGGVPGVQVGAPVLTDINGNYNFTGLMPGDYIVRFTTPAGGFIQTTANVGADATDSDAGVGGLTGCYTLTSGQTNNTVDAGFLKPAKLGDFVFLDSNNNGLQDATEVGINGVTVRLINTLTNAVLATTTTGVGTNDITTPGSETTGYYEFAGLTPGVGYTVEFVKPVGSNFTTANVNANGNDTTDSDANTVTGRSQSVTLISGEFNRTVDAGIAAPPPGIEIIKDVVGPTFVAANTPVTFTYSVRNTGGVELSNITVKDDNATPLFTADDFNPTPVLSAGFNIGDLDKDNKLDTTEIWKYSATVIPPFDMTVSVATGSTPINAGSLSYLTLANGDIRVFYRQDPNFNDNTYGTGSEGWAGTSKGTHTFKDLTGSDKAGFDVKFADGTSLVKFYQDYITLGGSNTESYTAFSGYQSLGITGGDGSTVSGNTAVLKDFDSTLELSMNQSGTATNGVAYTAMTVNSPTNDPKWDKVNGYYFTIDKSAFATKAFGGVVIFDQHNSPPKVGDSNTYVPMVKGGASINTAVVVGTPPTGPNVTDDDPATVIIVNGPLGSLGDRVWIDSDADGVQDAGEAGIVGAKLTLTADFDGNGTVDYTAMTNTGANGIYTFGGLPAGTYKVSVDPTTLGGTYSQTFDLDGISTANMATTTLTTGQNRTDVDFGYVGTNPGFTLDKVADKTTVVSGASVTYTYTVRNTTGATISNVVLRDDNATPNLSSDDFAPIRQADTVGDNDNLLEAGEVWRYTATLVPPVIMTVTIGSTVYDSGSLTYTTLANGDIRVDYLQSTNFNDNTYGTSAEGWAGSKNGTHTFKDLTGSDKAGFDVKFADGTSLVKFYQDYITLSGSNTEGYAAWSGHQSLGFSGGDGSTISGNTSVLKDFDSTLETSLNRTGYTSTWLTNSPTDAGWNKVNGYSFVIDKSAFATKAFGGVVVFDQHNSPPKVGDSNTYIPDVVGGSSTNTAVVTGTWNGQQLLATDTATVNVIPGGLSGSKFFVVDDVADDVFGYTTAGAGTAAVGLVAANANARGITGDAAGTKLWVLDKNDSVYVYSSAGIPLGNWVAGGLGTEPEGIALDGNNLWIIDSSTDTLGWYKNAAANVAGSDNAEFTFALPSTIGSATGIATIGNTLWIVQDATANTVYRYTITKNGSGDVTSLTAAGSWTLDTRNTTPTGITLDPTGVSQSLWVVDSGTDTVYQYANALTRTSGSNIAATSTFLLSTANKSPEDIFDPMIGGFGSDAEIGSTGMTIVEMMGPSGPGRELPSLRDMLGGDTLDGALGVELGGMASDMSLRDHGNDSASEMSDLLRRLTEMHRDDNMMATV